MRDEIATKEAEQFERYGPVPRSTDSWTVPSVRCVIQHGTVIDPHGNATRYHKTGIAQNEVLVSLPSRSLAEPLSRNLLY
jgi:hypothetical protein